MIGPKTIIGTIFFLLGSVFFVVASKTAYHQVSIAMTGHSTEGKISSINSRAAYRGGTTYEPIVRFRTPDGKEQVAVVKPGSQRRGAYQIGEPLSIIYESDDPSKAIEDSLWGRVAAVIGALFASLFVMLGAWLVHHERKEFAFLDD